MDYDLRIGKIEATLEANPKNIENMRQEMQAGFARHDEAITELRNHADQRLDELRNHTHQRIDELRNHTDQRIDELRAHMDQRFDEMRRDTTVNMRWLMSIWLTTMGMMVGMAGKVFGLY